MYLFLVSYLSGSLLSEFNDHLYKDLNDPEKIAEFNFIRIKCFVVTSLITCLCIGFISLEIKQLIKGNISEYLGDYWNVFDMISIFCNTGLVGTFTFTLCVQSEQIDIRIIRTFGAFASFWMWIKVFYWMRLFGPLAYYVKLI